MTGPTGTATGTVYITNLPPALGPISGGPTGGGTGSSGATFTGPAIATCAAGMSASIPGLPGPPIGTNYDPTWCQEQILTIAQQALKLQNSLDQIASLQQQVSVQQQMLKGIGSDVTSAPLALVNANAAKILQAATGIGFSSQAAGSAFAAAYPMAPAAEITVKLTPHSGVRL